MDELDVRQEMIAERQSKLTFIFCAVIATIFVGVWSLGLSGLIEVESPSTLVFSLIAYLFFVPFGLLMWTRVFNVPFAARIEDSHLTFWSMDLFPRQVSIPMASVLDARLAEKEVVGDTIQVLRLELSDSDEIDWLRSNFKSVSHFGFYDTHFDCALGLRIRSSHALAGRIRQQLRQGEQDAPSNR